MHSLVHIPACMYWMLDPNVANHEECTNRQTVVLIRNLINTSEGSSFFGVKHMLLGI